MSMTERLSVAERDRDAALLLARMLRRELLGVQASLDAAPVRNTTAGRMRQIMVSDEQEAGIRHALRLVHWLGSVPDGQ